MKPEFLSYQRARGSGRHTIIFQTVKVKTTGHLWWKKTYEIRTKYSVTGSGTVWHYLPNFERCHCHLELWLSGQYTRLQHEGKIR